VLEMEELKMLGEVVFKGVDGFPSSGSALLWPHFWPHLSPFKLFHIRVDVVT